jgi:hypothetical protein
MPPWSEANIKSARTMAKPNYGDLMILCKSTLGDEGHCNI